MRTRNSLLNFVTSFFPWILIAILGFLKIKLFINTFGSELNGLGQVYAYIGMIEMGFGSAVIYKMYKPFAENDYMTVSRIFKGSKRVYKIMAILMFVFGFVAAIGAATVINSSINKWYIFIIFTLYAFDYLALYSFNLPYQTLLIANQKKYKLNIVINTKNIIFRVIELFLIIVKVNYLYILIISVIFNLIISLILIKLVKREYFWIDENVEEDNAAYTMTKDVFIHKLSKIVYDNTDAIILSLFPNGLILVSIYTAYNYILTYLRQILLFVLSSAADSFGNLFNSKESNLKKCQDIYNEFFTLSLFLGIIISALFFSSVTPFINIWINENYSISILTVGIFSLILFSEYSLKPVTIISEANGKFKETKIIMLYSVVLNILLSIILGLKFQIIGVILSTLLVQLFIIIPLYVNYTYKRILKLNYFEYYKKSCISLALVFIICYLNSKVVLLLNLYSSGNYFSWFSSSCILGIIDFSLIIFIFVKLSKSFNQVIKRIKGVIKK